MANLALESINYFLKARFDSDRHLVLSEMAKSQLDKLPEFSTQASQASVTVRNRIIPSSTVTGTFANESSLMALVKTTDIEAHYPGIYEMFRLTILEGWTLSYILSDDGVLLTQVTEKDIKRCRKNIRALANWCGQYRSFRFLVEYLRDLDITEGYLQGQLNMILNSSDLRYKLQDAGY